MPTRGDRDGVDVPESNRAGTAWRVSNIFPHDQKLSERTLGKTAESALDRGVARGLNALTDGADGEVKRVDV